VVDIEVPTDHAISGTLQRLAAKYNLQYILSGNNVVTEAILPPFWIYNKNDYINLMNIHKKYGTIPLKIYPLFGFKEQYLYKIRKKIQTVKPLNFLSYNKEEAKKIIIDKLNWKDYGGKHYESVFTKFYQAFILPYKFNIDKRKAHLSNLIFSGQMTKKEAEEQLSEPLYEKNALERDKEYVLKKLGLSTNSFEELMNRPRVEHSFFGSQQALTKRYPLLKIFSPIKRIKKLF
jgi:hypothetical protein